MSEEIKHPPKEYIGDGVYAHFDGWMIWLTTQEGNKIAIEPQVYLALVTYARKCGFERRL